MQILQISACPVSIFQRQIALHSIVAWLMVDVTIDFPPHIQTLLPLSALLKVWFPPSQLVPNSQLDPPRQNVVAKLVLRNLNDDQPEARRRLPLR